jgi:hypothetical protein
MARACLFQCTSLLLPQALWWLFSSTAPLSGQRWRVSAVTIATPEAAAGSLRSETLIKLFPPNHPANHGTPMSCAVLPFVPALSWRSVPPPPNFRLPGSTSAATGDLWVVFPNCDPCLDENPHALPSTWIMFEIELHPGGWQSYPRKPYLSQSERSQGRQMRSAPWLAGTGFTHHRPSTESRHANPGYYYVVSG